MTVRACLGLACVVSATAAFSPAESEEAAAGRVTPTLEWLRDAIVKRGVPPRLVRIEHPEEGPASSSGQRPRPSMDSGRGRREPVERRPRLVFWTRTRRITQTVVVAIIGKSSGERSQRYVRIQSARLGQAPADHPRLAEVMSYLLDRNFAMTGAAFARDAADGEIVLRAELPVGEGLTEDEFTRALEVLLRVADEEAPRLEEMLGGDAGAQGVESSPVSDTLKAEGPLPDESGIRPGSGRRSRCSAGASCRGSSVSTSCHRGHRGHREHGGRRRTAKDEGGRMKAEDVVVRILHPFPSSFILLRSLCGRFQRCRT